MTRRSKFGSLKDQIGTN